MIYAKTVLQCLPKNCARCPLHDSITNDDAPLGYDFICEITGNQSHTEGRPDYCPLVVYEGKDMDSAPVSYYVAPGHGRFSTMGPFPEDGSYRFKFYYSKFEATPGVYERDEKKDPRNEWELMFSIVLKDPKSAESWSRAFHDAAERMRSDLENGRG